MDNIVDKKTNKSETNKMIASITRYTPDFELSYTDTYETYEALWAALDAEDLETMEFITVTFNDPDSEYI
jgi:hypothetical protein